MLEKFKTNLTNFQKNLIRIKKKELSNSPFIKAKIKGLKNSSGRNNSGKITVYHKGGGTKKKYRNIDFKRNISSVGIVVSIEYDPYRTSLIAAIYDYTKKNFYYILKPKYLKIGDIVKSGKNGESKIGHSMPLYKIPSGSYIHNVSTKSNKIGTLGRSAGNFCRLLEKTTKYGKIVLPSKEERTLQLNCFATIGILDNEHNVLKNIGKAGKNRWLNKRPTVRGVAMNPIDHPHGGGEGKTSGGRTSVTPWGKPSKDKKTSTSLNKYITLKRPPKKRKYK